MRHATRMLAPMLAAGLLLGACAPQSPDVDAGAVPEGYHRMPDGTLMANAAPAGETEQMALGAGDVTVPVHRSAETGELVLGTAPAAGHEEHAGHGSHAKPDPDDFPDGLVPARLRVPAIGADAVVETASLAPRIGISDDPGAVAWLEETRRPGQLGPSVIGGRTTIAGATTVVAEIGELDTGDLVVVEDASGDELAFEVSDVAAVATSDRQSLFAVLPGQSPELVLVAWHGAAGDDDLVVRAVLRD